MNANHTPTLPAPIMESTERNVSERLSERPEIERELLRHVRLFRLNQAHPDASKVLREIVLIDQELEQLEGVR